MVKKIDDPIEETISPEKDFEDLIKKAELLEEQEEEIPIKKKRRRKKVTTTSTPPSFEIDKTLLKPFINFPFDYFAKRYGNHWSLTKEEEETLIDLTAKVTSKWLPTWLEKFADEIALAFYVFIIVLPRVEQTKKLKESKTKVNEE